MDAGSAAAVPAQLAAALDLESGGGAAATVDAWPYAADPRLKEKQPFTWLRAAPYIAVTLVGAALFAAGVLVAATNPDAGPQGHRDTSRDVVGAVLYSTGAVVWMVGSMAAAIADGDGLCDRNLQRFGLDD